MHARKAMMAARADAFVAYPGGFGTLEELTEVVTWSQLGLHDKPCGVLNVEGYFDGLATFIEHMIARGFMPRSATRDVEVRPRARRATRKARPVSTPYAGWFARGLRRLTRAGGPQEVRAEHYEQHACAAA